MRLRNIPGAREEMLVNPFVVQNPQECRGRWREWFGEKMGTDVSGRPLFIEVGMGKGQFITTLAQQNPQCLYIGIEKYSSVLLRALTKQQELELPNLFFIRMDAEEIAEVFGKGEVSGIYLNFSDPWPKDRHAHRRLTSPRFLARYDRILAQNGRIEFKTDNRDLFQFSLDSASECGWTVEACTWDLHHDASLNSGNVMTEYEERFSAQGNPICKLVADRKADEK